MYNTMPHIQIEIIPFIHYMYVQSKFVCSCYSSQMRVQLLLAVHAAAIGRTTHIPISAKFTADRHHMLLWLRRRFPSTHFVCQCHHQLFARTVLLLLLLLLRLLRLVAAAVHGSFGGGCCQICGRIRGIFIAGAIAVLPAAGRFLLLVALHRQHRPQCRGNCRRCHTRLPSPVR